MTVRHLAAIAFLSACLAGCASAAGSSSSEGRGGDAGAALAPAQLSAGDAPAQSAAAQPATIVVGTPPSSDIERSVNATYTVPPGGFLTAFEGVIARGVGMGGYVVSSTTQPDAGGRIVSGAVTLKVPAAKLAGFLNGMPTGFVASSINFSAVDHTAQFVDVNARLASAHAHLAALDALLAKATSLGDITSLEQQIEAVQTEVDTDQGQLNVLTASVQLATATVALSERGTHVAVANPVSGGVGSGWDNAVHLTGSVLEGVVSALPLLILLTAALLVWWRLSRVTQARRRSGAVE
jgi:hypothetical protein